MVEDTAEKFAQDVLKAFVLGDGDINTHLQDLMADAINDRDAEWTNAILAGLGSPRMTEVWAPSEGQAAVANEVTAWKAGEQRIADEVEKMADKIRRGKF